MLRPGLLICLVAVACMLGCSGSGTDFVDTVPVSGVITQDGSPVPKAMVTFSPVEAGSGRAASAQTDANGKYTLTTVEANDGAVPGKYKVSVSKTLAKQQGQVVGSEEDPGAAYEEMEAAGVDILGVGGAAGQTEGEETSDDLLPVRFKTKLTTPIEAEVSKGTSEYDFELSDY